MSKINFGKYPEFVVTETKPFNGGPPVGLIHKSHITPVELSFVRNHGAVPEVDVNSYRWRSREKFPSR